VATVSIDTQGRLISPREEIIKDVTQLLKSNPQLDAITRPIAATPEVEAAAGRIRELKEGLAHFCQSISALSAAVRFDQKGRAILEQLYFPSMEQRERAISNPGEGIFQWVLDVAADMATRREDVFEVSGRKKRANTRYKLLEWLRFGTGVLYVSGKAGSGKSTLIKYLTDHKLVKESLKT